MPFQTVVLRVVIVSPSDVGPDRDAVEKCIHDWTSEHSYRLKVSLLPVRWETDASPDIGRPQEVINNQIIDPADIIVAVFRSKVGSPTGKEDSGTIEEIKRGIDLGKRVMIYFSRSEVDGTNPDNDQVEKLRQFKAWCRDQALYFEYENSDHLINQLRRHLSSSVDSIHRRLDEDVSAPSEESPAPSLTHDEATPENSESGRSSGITQSTSDTQSVNATPLDTGLVRRDMQLRACFDLSGLRVSQLSEDEIHIQFSLTNIGRHPGKIFDIYVENAGIQVYRSQSPHGETYNPLHGKTHGTRIPRAFAIDRHESEIWRFDMYVEFSDGVGNDRAEYVFYMEGVDPDFSFREDKGAAVLSPICRRRRG